MCGLGLQDTHLLNVGFVLPSRIEMEDSEAVGISNIISNLITNFPRSILTALPGELFSSFINCLTMLTCSFGRSAALEEVVRTARCARVHPPHAPLCTRVPLCGRLHRRHCVAEKCERHRATIYTS